ncbi:uncharacterized protein LOC122940062 isoform X4 [Bufo gargarizans]|uniref:uncharacterized protein LOC122940062 isoform X4 n=1 Tax=Bufo gargarizans TaxID=30331 RepID=UPI001CF489FA|nr:uncharacterized protein LOC122940062 isoform X4 [Bufo gargarizans]
MDKRHMTEKILNFTLEILYLLTGEDYTVVKKVSDKCVVPSSHHCVSGGWSKTWSSTMDSPPHSLTPERTNEQKILDLANKIIELLTGEVPIRFQDVTVHFSMEEWEYLEGHVDLYKDFIMENYQSLTSSDGSSKRNPQMRCPSPLPSLNCPREHHNVPMDHQVANLFDIKVEIIDDEEENDMRADQQDGSSKRDPAEKCPNTLYPWNCEEVDHHAPQKPQDEDLLNIKVVVIEEEEEEMYLRGDRQFKEEEIPLDMCPAG